MLCCRHRRAQGSQGHSAEYEDDIGDAQSSVPLTDFCPALCHAPSLPPGVKLHLTPVTAISLIGIHFTPSGHTQTTWLCSSQPKLLQAVRVHEVAPVPMGSSPAGADSHALDPRPGQASGSVFSSALTVQSWAGCVLMVIRVECLGDTHAPHPLWLLILLTCLF